MNAGWKLCVLPVFMLSLACASPSARDRPFSQDWIQQIQREREFDRRKERLRGPTPSADSLVYMDDEGRPRVRVGGETGWSANVDYDEGAKARLKYKLEWDTKKPRRGRR